MDNEGRESILHFSILANSNIYTLKRNLYTPTTHSASPQ